MSEADDAVALEYVAAYASDAVGLDDDVTRYVRRSAQFGQAGGALGSLIGPPVGTAIGAMVGAQLGVVYEAASDIGKWLFGDDIKHTVEDPEEGERAYYTYGDMGFEEGTGLPYNAWWKLYVAAGRPSTEVLKAAQAAERAAQRIVTKQLVEDGPEQPRPPEAPKMNFVFPLLLAIGIAVATIGIGKVVR